MNKMTEHRGVPMIELTTGELMNAQTKGGLNEQAMGLMTETKGITHKTLDTILNRLQKPKN